MAVEEQLTFDGLSLSTTPFALRELIMQPPRKRSEWITGADADGSALVRNPLFENREIVATLQVIPQASMNLALDQIGELVDKLEEAERQPNGLALVWTPAGATDSLTFYVLSGEIDELPISIESGWLVKAPSVTLRMVCKPFGYGTPLANITDDFSTNTIANYTFDAGSGTLSVSGGQLVPSSTTEKRIYHSASPYDLNDCQVTLKFTTGATVTTDQVGLILRRLDATNYLYAEVGIDGASSELYINKVDVGSTTLLAFSGSFTIATATSYWLRFRAQRNLLTIELFGSAPTATTTPSQTVSHTLTGGDATKFGNSVAGRAGIRTDAVATDYRYDDFTIEPNLWRGTDPLLTGHIIGVPGDVPAEGRLIVTDAATHNRRHVEWGLEQRYMNPALNLIIDSDSLVTSGFAGAQTTRTGAYDPNASGNNVIRATLVRQAVAVCGTGNLSHVGTFRVRCRIYATSLAVNARLVWQEGDGPYAALPWQPALVFNGFCELDLGVITIPPAALGTQRWVGRIEAYSTVTAATIDVDYLELIPVEEGYGKARAAVGYQASALVASDEFTSTTAGNALNARAAPLGGTWATSGAATDLSFADAPGAGEETITRASSVQGARFAVLGSTNYTDVEVGAFFQTTAAVNVASQRYGVFARYVDSSNFIFAGARTASPIDQFALITVEAGVRTDVAANYASISPINRWWDIRLIVYASGTVVAWLFVDTVPIMALTYSSTLLATGGALATGKPGILDDGSSSISPTRYYDNFYVATPATESIALYSAQSIEIRHDDTIREDSTGVYWGRPPSYRGSQFFVPEAGDENRDSRVVVKARRNDVDVTADDQIADTTQAQGLWTPRYVAAPR